MTPLAALPRSLENSEQEFMDRYAAYAAEGQLYPQTEGSPLLEFSAGGRVLYLFDRTGPYCGKPGPARVLVHGILDPALTQVVAGGPEKLMPTSISALEGVGQVLEASRRVVAVRARIPLVLATFDGLPDLRPGDWLAFGTLPPLHGFVLE